MLSQEQVKTFQAQGFIIISLNILHDACDRIKRAACRIAEQCGAQQPLATFTTSDRDAGRDRYFLDSAERVSCFFEPQAVDEGGRLTRPPTQAINKIGHALHDHVAEITELARAPWLGELLRDIGYRTPQLWQSMLLFKPPGIGGEVRWHQDASYLFTRPASVTGLWLALEDATTENGCLLVQPGGHRGPLRERFTVNHQDGRGTLHTLDDTPWPDTEEAVALEVPKGSLVVFDDHLPHASAPNRSQHSRLALSLHVAEADADWPASNWLQRPHLPPFLV